MGLELWVYYAWFLDYDNTVKPIFPVDRISILPSSLGSMEYAAITNWKRMRDTIRMKVPEYQKL